VRAAAGGHGTPFYRIPGRVEPRSAKPLQCEGVTTMSTLPAAKLVSEVLTRVAVVPGAANRMVPKLRPFLRRSAVAQVLHDNICNGFENFVKLYKQPKDDAAGYPRQAVTFANCIDRGP
jgi:hypothetical protein